MSAKRFPAVSEEQLGEPLGDVIGRLVDRHAPNQNKIRYWTWITAVNKLRQASDGTPTPYTEPQLQVALGYEGDYAYYFLATNVMPSEADLEREIAQAVEHLQNKANLEREIAQAIEEASFGQTVWWSTWIHAANVPAPMLQIVFGMRGSILGPGGFLYYFLGTDAKPKKSDLERGVEKALENLAQQKTAQLPNGLAPKRIDLNKPLRDQ